MARGLFAATSSVFKQSSSKQQAKISMNVSNVNKGAIGLEIDDPCGGIGDLMLMLELRNKVIAFRDILGLPPFDDTAALTELIMQTLVDLKKLYPSILSNIKETDEVSLQKELAYLYEALKSIGDIWSKNHVLVEKSVHSADGSPNAMNLNQLGGRVIRKLDNMIKAGRQIFDNMLEDGKINGGVSREVSSDIKNTSPSPASPASVVHPDVVKLSALADASHSLPTSMDTFPVVSLQGSIYIRKGTEKADELTDNFSNTKSTAKGLPVIELNEVSTSSKSLINPQSNLTNTLKARRPKEELRSISQPSIPSSRVPLMHPPPLPLSTVGISQLNGAPPPPPPPALGVPKFLGLKRSNSKLRRSSHMGNLYRNLKRKLEGSNVMGTVANKVKCQVGGATRNAKQGMADALAEMTKRSAYFHQIEEDVHQHSQMIMKLRHDIPSFKTKDMAELLKFVRDMEQHLEQLSDETQVLARFEDFPTKKMESLRIAAAMHSKLEGIAHNLENWKIEPPLEQLLDKVEGYFNKIKGHIEALDGSKDEESKLFRSHDIEFDFKILIKIKELMVDVSSGCIELALKESRETTDQGKRQVGTKLLWRAFQLAFRVYTFAGGQDDRADKLTKELGRILDTH